MVVRRKNKCTINLHNHKRNSEKWHCIYRFWSTKSSYKTPLNLWDSWDQLGHTGAQSRGPLVKSEFFFFCVFSRYLWNEDSSVDLTLILPYSAPGLFIAQSIFRELLSAFSNVGSLRHVTSRHVTFCDSQFIQQQEDTQWVLRTTMGEF